MNLALIIENTTQFISDLDVKEYVRMGLELAYEQGKVDLLKELELEKGE